MRNSLNTSKNSLNGQNKDKEKTTQVKTIFYFLKYNTATTSMIAAATGISKYSICRYKKNLEKQGLLWEIEKKPCKITGHKAWYFTSNPHLKKDSPNNNHKSIQS